MILALGVAFDVGSTTIAGHLCDLRPGRARHASPDRSRDRLRRGPDEPCSYVMMNEDGATRLTAVVRGLDELIGGT